MAIGLDRAALKRSAYQHSSTPRPDENGFCVGAASKAESVFGMQENAEN